MDKNTIIIEQAKLFNQELSLEQINYIVNNNIVIYSNNIDTNYDFSKNILLEEINWIYDNNNLRIPYWDSNKLSQIKLELNDNIYDYISSSVILSDDDVICGEKIMSICDVFIGSTNSINANPNNVNIQKNIINIDNDIKNVINQYNTIFVKTDDLLYFYCKVESNNINLRDKLIISHNSDIEINSNYNYFLNKIKKQFSQNCLIKHENLYAIPIGIENKQWFNHEILHKIRINQDIKKEKNIYFFFSLSTHFSRNECYEKLKNKLQWNKKLSKEEYFIELKKHKYAICPRGNGIDTHRIWECLYLDVIPIMLKKDYINIDNLPIIYLNDWDELNVFDINNSFKNIKLSQITMNFYTEKISKNLKTI
jgi:hypothetical protein